MNITDPSTISIVTPPLTFEEWALKHNNLECPSCAAMVRDCACGYGNTYMGMLWEDARRIADNIVDKLLSEKTNDEPYQA